MAPVVFKADKNVIEKHVASTLYAFVSCLFLTLMLRLNSFPIQLVCSYLSVKGRKELPLGQAMQDSSPRPL